MSPFAPSVFRAAALAFCAASTAGADTIPLNNDFSSGGLENTGLFTQPGGGVLRYTVTTNNSANPPVAYSSSQLTNAANTSFTLSTQFAITSIGTTGLTQSVAIGFFGVDAAFSGAAATPYLTASYTFTNGTMSITEVDGTNTVLGTTSAFDLNGATTGFISASPTLYTLKLGVTSLGSGTYSLSFGLFDAAGTTQVAPSSALNVASYSIASTTTDTDVNPNGFYGIRARLPQTSGTTTAEFSDFSATAIPEPSTYAALAGLGALGLAAFRRRRA
ncbi:MAG: PEP-CTERM sorting domain-containing protein [Opitutaceae bacterium]|nr:PEP-CTERM sorting domain-containing protein [Opitutaceae bacterium]